jgi:hypothetical protein
VDWVKTCQLAYHHIFSLSIYATCRQANKYETTSLSSSYVSSSEKNPHAVHEYALGMSGTGKNNSPWYDHRIVRNLIRPLAWSSLLAHVCNNHASCRAGLGFLGRDVTNFICVSWIRWRGSPCDRGMLSWIYHEGELLCRTRRLGWASWRC